MKCFLITYNCRDRKDRFEIRLYARSEKKRPVEITVTNYRPLFFIPSDTDKALTEECAQRKPLALKSMSGISIDCCYFKTLESRSRCAYDLDNKGIELCESDVEPVERFLMERGVKGSFSVEGGISEEDGLIKYFNPKIRGIQFSPDLSVIFIHTGFKNNRLKYISCISERDNSPRLYTLNKEYSGDNIYVFNNEVSLIKDFICFVKEKDPDLITGWNNTVNDINLILKRANLLNIPVYPQREFNAKPSSSKSPDSFNNVPFLKGRLIFDTAGALGRNINKTGKELLHTTAVDLLGKDGFYNNPGKAALYSSAVIKHIFEKNNILHNEVERSKLSGRLCGSRGDSILIFDYLYLPLLHKKGYIADNRKHDHTPSSSLSGGYVIEPEAGIYENVILLDFKSLYPTIMLSFNIDPLGYHIKKAPDIIITPEGVKFSCSESILSTILLQLMSEREKAKNDNNKALSNAVKIIMNSFYGVLGSKSCRFFSYDIASAITSTGRHLLKKTREIIESETNYRVIYGDTDSLFVYMGKGNQHNAVSTAERITSLVNKKLSGYLEDRFNAKSYLQLEFENHFRYFFMPALRNQSQGSKKKYCGAVENSGELELIFKGMEYSRTDWTPLARDFQYELMMRIFKKENITDYILSITKDLRKGYLDSKLVFTKGISKPLNEYMGTVPRHIQAAIKLNKGDIDTVSYVVTKNGPEPVGKASSTIDYEHYVQSQIKPVADQVLALKNTDFDSITSGQTNLF